MILVFFLFYFFNVRSAVPGYGNSGKSIQEIKLGNAWISSS